jgi:sterol desaturase/sphingolipid hydroxylase (fatty acid hydroxylase superfamily)
MFRSLAWSAAGFTLAPLLEYGWHAWIAHGKRDDPTRREHLEHHRAAYTVRDPWEEIGANTPRIAALALGVNAVLASVLGLRRTAPLTLGLVAGYAFSTLYHAQMHERAPRSPYEEWMWRFHWYHHATNARTNFGLTNPVFDFVFGTAFVPTEVVVSERLRPAWLTHEHPGFRIRRNDEAATSS